MFEAISQIWQENFSKYVVWIGTKAYISGDPTILLSGEF